MVVRSHLDIRFTTTEDGATLAYWEVGTGKAVMMIQNFSLTHAELEWEVPAMASLYADMAKRYRLIRFDWRGVGLSGDRPAGTRDRDSTGELCRDIEAVAAAVGVDKFALIATSVGGPIAIEYAVKHPEQITQLVLCNAMANVGSSHISDALLAEETLLDRAFGSRSFLTIWQSFVSEEDREPIARIANAWQLREGASTGVLSWDASSLLPQIQTPTLIMSSPGFWDGAIDDARVLAAAIPGSQLSIIPGTEAPYWSDRTMTIDALSRFLGPGDVQPESPGGFRTVVFTDVVDSTRFLSEVGDQEGRQTIRQVEQFVSEVASRHGGRVIKNLGDGSLVAFGSNTAALRFAVEIQTERDPTSLQLRVGLAAGEPIDEAGDIHGAVVALASRIAGLGGAGEITVSDTVRQLAMGKGFDFSPMGQFELKGFEEPATVWKVSQRSE